MRIIAGIVASVLLTTGAAFAVDQALFQGELDVTNFTAHVINQSYLVNGEFADWSVQGFDGTMVSTGDLIFVETEDGSADVYAVTNITSAGYVDLSFDVECVNPGGTSTLGMVAGIAAICTLSTNNAGFAQQPSLTGARISEHLANAIRNYNFRRISEGGADLTASFNAHTNNESADIQHLTAAEKTLATNSVQQGAAGTSTNLSDYNNDAGYLTNETYLGTITGATIAAGSSDSVVVTGPNAAITWNTNAAGGGVGNVAYWSGYAATQMLYRMMVDGLNTSYCGDRFVAYASNTNVLYDATNRIMWARDTDVLGDDYNYFDTTNLVAELVYAGYSDWRLPTREEVTNVMEWCELHPFVNLDKYKQYWMQRYDGTYYVYEWTLAGLIRIVPIHPNDITNTLTSVHVVRDVPEIQEFFGVDNDGVFKARAGLFLADLITPALELGGERRTNWPAIINLGVGSADSYRGDWGAGASNLAYSASTNAEAARVIATNAQAVANDALPKSGGTMSGTINAGAQSITNATNVSAHSMTMTGGNLNMGGGMITNANYSAWQFRVGSNSNLPGIVNCIIPYNTTIISNNVGKGNYYAVPFAPGTYVVGAAVYVKGTMADKAYILTLRRNSSGYESKYGTLLNSAGGDNTITIQTLMSLNGTQTVDVNFIHYSDVTITNNNLSTATFWGYRVGE
jgi:hypothetical protein